MTLKLYFTLKKNQCFHTIVHPRMTEPALLSSDHPFFKEILAIPVQGILNEQGIIRRVIERGEDIRHRFLELLNTTYLPICRTSPAAFGRIAKQVKDPIMCEKAVHLLKVEEGLYPVVEGLPKTSHEALFTEMLQGLAARPLHSLSERGKNSLVRKLRIPTAPMPVVVSYAKTIESDFAPPLANAWNDFVTQWLALTGKKSDKVNWRFIDEHRLTEGVGETQEQSGMHIDLIETMCAPYADVLAKHYEKYRAQYHRVLCDHLDSAVASIKHLVAA